MRVTAIVSTLLALHAGAIWAEVPKVATDIAPVHSLVARVMKGIGEPDLVIPPGASPHAYAMRPSEARSLSQADLVIWVGPELTPWLEEGIESLAPDATRLSLLSVPGTVLLEFRDGSVFDEHGHGGEHDDDHAGGHDDHGEGVEEDHEEHHDHDHSGIDPHAWLDPVNGSVWLGAIAEELARLDPESANAYRANAKAGQAELADLQTTIAEQLEPVRGVPFVVFHDAYHYFEARFGIETLAAISLGDASAPGAARLSEIRAAVLETGARCAFAEPQFNPGLIAAVSDGGEIATAVLDPLRADVSDASERYPATLRGIADAMADCLGN